ncbi:hypothetical protein EG328_003455 [Venturia inaequalis]|uniref:Uncharacterized protein n=1 Tax=Venturia inaequalis TaxID=5025 RepID=A0A8H3YV78_VENIN|nr:hypothetical protein EG328_003455 [Venturia inaequalis]RDI79131.1 hypothetical protein Vi05172_g10912 [Venturia inaequalis]
MPPKHQLTEDEHEKHLLLKTNAASRNTQLEIQLRNTTAEMASMKQHYDARIRQLEIELGNANDGNLLLKEELDLARGKLASVAALQKQGVQEVFKAEERKTASLASGLTQKEKLSVRRHPHCQQPMSGIGSPAQPFRYALLRPSPPPGPVPSRFAPPDSPHSDNAEERAVKEAREKLTVKKNNEHESE